MKTLHLISHTHWDREWYLTFQQFRLKLVHLVDGLLDILETDGQYRYFMLDGQTIVLDDYLEIRPARRADLTRYIQNGRILIGPGGVFTPGAPLSAVPRITYCLAQLASAAERERRMRPLATCSSIKSGVRMATSAKNSERSNRSTSRSKRDGLLFQLSNKVALAP